MTELVRRQLHCCHFLLSALLLLSVPAQAEDAYAELVAKGNAAMANKSYDAAEANYADAIFSAGISATDEIAILRKLKAVYQASGQHPLDERIKSKLAKLDVTAKPPVPRYEQPVKSYPVVTGEAGKVLVAYALKTFDQACRDRVPGYLGSKNPIGTAFKLPNDKYQVVASCDSSIQVDGQYLQAQLTVIQTVQYLGDGVIKSLGRDVMVGQMTAADGSTVSAKSTSSDSFSKWMQEQTRKNAEATVRAEQTAAQNQRANAADEQSQLSRMHEQTQSVTGTSYFSRH